MKLNKKTQTNFKKFVLFAFTLGFFATLYTYVTTNPQSKGIITNIATQTEPLVAGIFFAIAFVVLFKMNENLNKKK